jgi:hypothetical protein
MKGQREIPRSRRRSIVSTLKATERFTGHWVKH